MTNISEAELNAILANHAKWIEDPSNGERANLHGANLRGAILCRADLQGADLPGANLHGADLHGSNLQGADLHGSNLQGADLHGANLRGADLYGSNLHGADLLGANLRGANLHGANLCAANEDFVNEIVPLACPDSGSFIGYKKAIDAATDEPVIVKLLIPEDAKRLSATGRTCRCDKALVLEFQDLSGNTISDLESRRIVSQFDPEFVYRIGETVHSYGYQKCAQYFDPDRWKECAPGIHFFITRGEAVYY